ncbi:MAG: apolipoprotein N-acyltransferase, partial [Propionicimonas sp.]|nr:apolipoprotein N-acyltransferase [Propionicimonas sp.]
MAVVAGVATGAGYAPAGWWTATVLGVSGLAVAARQTTTPKHAAGIGYLYGLGLTVVTLTWMSAIHAAVAAGLVLVVSGWYALLR